MERVKGVEPSSLAWEAKVMPLYDARIVKHQPQLYRYFSLSSGHGHCAEHDY